MDRIDEIRARLDAAAKDWRCFTENGRFWHTYCETRETDYFSDRTAHHEKGNAEFIANARADIEYLLSLL